ncbi:hypothetical protein T552_01584 [Pneumocystis carinii B80]|uniref:Reticulon-like protein n=1 Tax=Pneumocystis carinii (strain B80) TaxID=1408658 RepID=A0A0W4ZKP8_PNEC8|nr:hypothetical protein T552_01584 [Pneumocystis carinii B80]KTW28954.1 hypothetical protein T552_01584 [Pneumocystis carinii B80]
MTSDKDSGLDLNKETSDTCLLSKKSPCNAYDSQLLSKYYLFFSDLFTWKYPRTSGSVLGGVTLLLLLSNTVDIPRLILRTAWIVFASSTVIEITGRSLFKQHNGFISQFAPTSFYSISRTSLTNVIDKTCDLINFALYGFQELLFARKIRHTATAFIVSWISFVLVQFLSFVHTLLLGVLLAFTVPLFYIKYQKTIDKYFKSVLIITRKYSCVLKKYAGKYTEKTAKKLSSDFIKLGTKINNDMNKFRNGFMKNKTLLNLKVKKAKSTVLPKTPISDISTAQEVLTEGIEKHDTNVPITT